MRASLIQAFAALRQGETLPFSRFPAEWSDEMLSEGRRVMSFCGARACSRTNWRKLQRFSPVPIPVRSRCSSSETPRPWPSAPARAFR